MRRVAGALFTCLLAAATLAARTDPWDRQTNHDNSFMSTSNELVHGSDQMHDMAALPGPAIDADWYRISQRPYSSYEVLVEGVSGDLFGRTFQVLRVASDGVTTIQSSQSVGLGFVRSLRWANHGAKPVNNEFVLVHSPACGTDCGVDDVYRIRVSETTYAAPRFNNSGTQISVLLLQNPTDYTASGTVYLWTASGALTGSYPFTLTGKTLAVVNLAVIAPGTSGALTIAHDARYGDLGGKIVALEPATGFSFDTLVTPRPR